MCVGGGGGRVKGSRGGKGGATQPAPPPPSLLHALYPMPILLMPCAIHESGALMWIPALRIAVYVAAMLRDCSCTEFVAPWLWLVLLQGYPA